MRRNDSTILWSSLNKNNGQICMAYFKRIKHKSTGKLCMTSFQRIRSPKATNCFSGRAKTTFPSNTNTNTAALQTRFCWCELSPAKSSAGSLQSNGKYWIRKEGNSKVMSQASHSHFNNLKGQTDAQTRTELSCSNA